MSSEKQGSKKKSKIPSISIRYNDGESEEEGEAETFVPDEKRNDIEQNEVNVERDEGLVENRKEKKLKVPELSRKFLESVSSKNIHEWTAEDAQKWLKHVFAGSSEQKISKYLEYFTEYGVTGEGLLDLDEQIYSDIGIKEYIHLKKIRTMHEQLVNYQEKFDQQEEQSNIVINADRIYLATKAEYEQIQRSTGDSLSHIKFDSSVNSWKLVQVYAFFMKPEYEELASVFLKPLINSEINGERLLFLADPKTRVERKLGSEKTISYGANGERIVKLVDLRADEHEIEVLKERLHKLLLNQKEKQKREKESAKNELKRNLYVDMNETKLTPLEQVGKGGFGRVYRAKFEKKNVVIKILSSIEQRQTSLGTNQEEENSTTINELTEDLKYEAEMLYKSQMNGVVKMIAFVENRNPPCIVTEYLPNKSLEHEFKLYSERGDVESIFHPENEHNRLLDQVSHPVLLQVVRIARDIASVLERLHDRVGIIHLDIAARNILLDMKKRPKLADFGHAAPEIDMKEMYEICRRDDFNEEEAIKDTEFARKYRIYKRVHATKWMPHWALADPPLLDRHTDIYSFGCLMYELITCIPPHGELKDADVRRQKKNGPFNPVLPGNIHPRYKAIIASCWEDYDLQPLEGMSKIAEDLSDLHRELAIESVSSLQTDLGYVELGDLKRKPGTTFSTKGYTGSTNSFFQQRRRVINLKSKATSVVNRIQLNFDNVDLIEGSPLVAKLQEYELEGYDRNKFESALNSAKELRNHQSIALYMICIQIDNNSDQLQLISKCLGYLYQLAEDQHGKTNEDDEYIWLCSAILNIVREVYQVAKEVSFNLKCELINNALLALSSLLANRTLTNNEADEASAIETELCTLITETIDKYSAGDDIICNVSKAVISFSGLSQAILFKMNAAGIVAGLLGALNEFKNNFETALKIVEAITCFPIQFLVECSQLEDKFGNPSSSSKKLSSPSVSGSGESANTTVYNILFSLVQSSLRSQYGYSNNLGNRRNTSSKYTETTPDSPESLNVTLLETCLSSLFKMCESGINEKPKINALLLPASLADIDTLFQTIKFFPSNFRVQEGAIGLLAHVLSTGFPHSTFLKGGNRPNISQVQVTIPPIASCDQRLGKYLSLDPSLSYLLSAMEKFRINDKNALGINPSPDRYQPSRIYRSDNYDAMGNKSRRPIIASGESKGKNANEEDGDERNFDLDKAGEPITAAALQRSVAIILGIACSSPKYGTRVQDSLVQSKYNELILAAFKNYARDVNLVRFGCQALSCTARRHDKHQKNLRTLMIFKHLVAVLSRHQSVADVVDGVICAFMGLLEPPNEVSMLPEVETEQIKYQLGLTEDEIVSKLSAVDRKRYQLEEAKALAEHKKQFVGYYAAEFLTTPLGLQKCPTLTLLQFLAVRVDDFAGRTQANYLVTSFLKLLGCIGFWLPPGSKNWDPDGTFVDLSVLKSNFLALLFFKIATAAERRNDRDAASVAGIAAFEMKIGEPVSLAQYTLKLMKLHKSSVEVISAGLAVMVSVFRRHLTNDDLVLGDEIKSYQDIASPVSVLRRAFKDLLTEFCKFASDHQDPDPILIRYSLWMLIILISEKGHGEFVADIVSDLSISGLVEWAVRIAKNYPGFYSLQVLCIHFFIWMEDHKLLSSGNKTPETLEDILAIARTNEASQQESFLDLFEEGHDTYLMAEEKNFFGDLRIVSKKLLRALKSLPTSSEKESYGNRYEEGRGEKMNSGSSNNFTNYASSNKESHRASTNKVMNNSDSDDEFQLEEMSEELEVRPSFIKLVPLNAQEWTAQHAMDWFHEIFFKEKKKEFFEGFERAQYTGEDLLKQSESEMIEEIGLIYQQHKNNFSKKLKRLRAFREKQLAETKYYEMEKEFKENKDTYQSPMNLNAWTTFDIYFFLKKSKTRELMKFLKPITLSELNGEDLIQLSQPATEVNPQVSFLYFPYAVQVKHRSNRIKSLLPESMSSSKTSRDSVGVKDGKKDLFEGGVMYLIGLDSSADIEKFKSTIRNLQKDMETKVKQDKRDEEEKLWGKLGTFDRRNLTILEYIGKGSFGNVYRAQYEKRTVVVKQLSVAGSNRTKEQLADDLTFEAKMLLNSETVGVIKLIAIIPDYDPPRMVLEYLPNGNLEREYKIAKTDPRSIFHPENESNVAEKKNNPAVNPVLLQMVRIARDVAGALTRIHEKGIIHLDIAARNILLDLNKRPKLADFGCAVEEKDMKLMYDYVDKKKKNGEMHVEPGYGDDTDMQRKYSMYMRERPVQWMPHWAFDDPPKIDRKCDIYAFGCVMYEMYTYEPPHEKEAVEQVKLNKQNQRATNPDVPRDMDPAYTSIMISCWDSYDRQEKMPDIAKRLSTLHTDLATKNVPKDKLYSELLVTLAKGRSDKYNGEIHSHNSDFNHSSPPTSVNSSVSVSSSRHRYDRPTSFQQYEDEGSHRNGGSRYTSTVTLIFDNNRREVYDERKLLGALNCAYRFRDHQFVLQILKSVFLREEESVGNVVKLCLEHLGHLAEDQHGSTNEEETYQWLAKGIMEILKEVKRLEFADAFVEEIVGYGLSALGMLLVNKSLPEKDEFCQEGSRSFQDDLCSIIFNAIKDFSHSTDFSHVAEQIAIAVFSISGLSQTIVKKLHSENAVVGSLLEMLDIHKEDYSVVVEIVRALSCFPIQYLLDPIFSINPESTSQPLRLAKVVSLSSHRGRKALALEQPSATKSNRASARDVSKVDEKWGLVYSRIFRFVGKCVEQYERRASKEKNDKLAELLLENCLSSLFRICESGLHQIDLVNKILHKVEKDDIFCLFKTVKLFPNSFRMQEGAIGLLSHIISTGFPVYIRDTGGRIIRNDTIEATVSSEARMSTLLSLDPKLNLILDAVDKFKIKEDVSTGIKEKDPDYLGAVNISQTAFQKAANHATSLAPTRTKLSATVLDFSKLGNESDEPIENNFNLDERGEQITAAALQRCGAVIMGASCNSRKSGKTMQDNLKRSKFNEVILASFRNFRNDVTLIRFGCHALYYTSRRHANHQETLKKLSIEKHLHTALITHKDIWEIVEAVICAVTGILEPPNDVNDMTNEMYDSMFKSIRGAGDSGSANKQKIIELTEQAINQKKTMYVGYWLSKELIKDIGGGNTVFQSLTLSVAANVIYEECYLLLRNYLLLVCCIGYWLPEVMNVWNTSKFVNLDRLMLSKENTKFKEQFKLVLIPHSKSEKMLFHFSSKAKNKNKIENFRNDYDFNFVQFTLLTLHWHSSNPDVLAAGLAILTGAIRKSISKNQSCDYLISEDHISEYSNPNSEISRHRQIAIDTDLFLYCMEACARQEDHPILIRYSLWLLSIFIAEQDENPNDKTEAKIVAGELRVGDCLSWAIDVCKRYEQFYTLQVLSALFMLWMDYHGFFETEDLERLKEVKVIMEKNVKEDPSIRFRALEEEGIDSYLLGVTIDTFGNIKSIGQKLIDRIDGHIHGTSHIKFDTLSFEKPFRHLNWETRTEQTREGLDGKKPDELRVPGFHQELKDGNKYYVFEIEIYWSGGKRWGVQRTFEECLQLKDDLDHELCHMGLNLVTAANIKRTVGGAFSKAFVPQSTYETRRVYVQQWLNELITKRAVINNSRFLGFLSAVANRDDDTSFARRLPALNVLESSTFAATSMQVISSVHVSSEHNLLIVATGLTSAFSSAGSSSGKIAGQVTIYTIKSIAVDATKSGPNVKMASWSFENTNFMKVCTQEFTVPVTQVSYEPLRRLVLVGLNTGPLVFFSLNEHCDELLYRTELNFHYGRIVNILVDTTYPDNHYCVVSSDRGSICLLNLNSGLIDSKASCDIGQKLHCVVYNPYDNILICATDKGQIILFDCDRDPAIVSTVLRIEDVVPMPQDRTAEYNEVLAVSFDSKRRLIYACCGSEIFIWRVFTKEKNVSLKTKYQRMLRLGTLPSIPGPVICNSMLLNDAQFLLVGEKSGRMAMFDLFEITNYPLRSPPDSQPTNWEDAVDMGFSSMLGFLHKKGVDTSSAITREDIINLMASKNRVTEDEIVTMLTPKKQGTEIILAWSTVEPIPASQKPLSSVTPSDRSLFCFTMLPSLQYLICGGEKGQATIFSLADFIIPPTSNAMNNAHYLDITMVMAECKFVALKNGQIINCKGSNQV